MRSRAEGSGLGWTWGTRFRVLSLFWVARFEIPLEPGARWFPSLAGVGLPACTRVRASFLISICSSSFWTLPRYSSRLHTLHLPTLSLVFRFTHVATPPAPHLGHFVFSIRHPHSMNPSEPIAGHPFT
jgi:hypothetical protein